LVNFFVASAIMINQKIPQRTPAGEWPDGFLVPFQPFSPASVKIQQAGCERAKKIALAFEFDQPFTTLTVHGWVYPRKGKQNGWHLPEAQPKRQP
jgi:hypothetical protein